MRTIAAAWAAFAILAFSFPPPVRGQIVLVQYDGTSAAPADAAAGVVAGSLTALGEVSFIANVITAGDTWYETAGWPIGDTPPLFNVQSLYFTLEPGAGFQLTLESFQFTLKSAGNGPDKIKLELAINDDLNPFNDTVAENILELTNSSALTFSWTNNTGSPIVLLPDQTARFFIVGYDYRAGGSAYELLMTDISIRGQAEAIPEPSSLTLVAGSLLLGLVLRHVARRAFPG